MNNRFLLLIFFGGILVNITGYHLAVFSELPVFFDCGGSILAGVILGPVVGGLTGFTSNLITGVFHNPINIPFSAVNAIIGITAGELSRRIGFSNIRSLLLCIFLLTIISSIFGALISFYLFGGITGITIDAGIVKMMESGYSLYVSSVMVRLASNFFDKGISCVVVYLAVMKMKPECRFLAGRN